MKLGITGSRSITDFDFYPYFTLKDASFRRFCRTYGSRRGRITTVFSGGAAGVDSSAFLAAERLSIRNVVFLPDRVRHPGRLFLRSYQERNERIVDSCDLMLAVWNGTSHGTRNAIRYARKVKKPVYLVLPEGKISIFA